MERFSVAEIGDLNDLNINHNHNDNDNKKDNKKAKIMVIFITLLFIILSIIACAIDKPDMYNPSITNDDLFIDTGDTAWVLVSTCLVFIMTPGAGYYFGNFVDVKNIVSTFLQSFISLSLLTILWVVIGFSLSFGEDDGNGIIGNPKTYFLFINTGSQPHAILCPTIPLILFAMFQLMFAIITPILISGAIAERVNFYSWMIFISIWHIIVYCPLVHLVWSPNGRLRTWGYIDFAGGLPVEVSSGFAALTAVLYIGPRKTNVHRPASLSNVLLGSAICWFGWLAFNAGSALGANAIAANTLATTQIGAASSMLTWMFIDICIGRKVSIPGLCNGLTIGLVALTPSSGYITPGAALLTGVISSYICYFAGNYTKQQLKVDDAFDVLAVHGIGGVVGIICTGLFASNDVNPSSPNGLIYGNGELLGKK